VRLAGCVAAGSPAGSSDTRPAAQRIDVGPYGFDNWTEAEGLPQATVRTITRTRDGHLGLGTSGGLVRFDGVSFTRYSTETGALEDNEVRTVVEGEAGQSPGDRGRKVRIGPVPPATQ